MNDFFESSFRPFSLRVILVSGGCLKHSKVMLQSRVALPYAFDRPGAASVPFQAQYEYDD